MQCDIWVVFRVSISSDYKDTTRGEKQKQFFAGVVRSLFLFVSSPMVHLPVCMFEGVFGHV